jgi:ABC-2 type transport system ATP-binding protein
LNAKPKIMHNRIDEIKSFLSHQDYSLAVRRMLDICLDAGNNQLLVDSILWSRLYRSHEKKNAGQLLPQDFFSQADALLVKLEDVFNNEHAEQQPLINAERIGKTYSRGNFSLMPMSLKLNTSEVMGVVGENGNGKTTLLRCLAGQLALDSGNITYSRLHRPDYYDIKHHVAFIPQRIPRWYGLLKDNLHFSASLSGIKGEQNELMVSFMLERLNLTDYAHLTWNQISSGYRTRFELARILLQKPSLLILDEPLANLDINAQQTILTDLRYMAKSIYHPMGIILSSQQLHEVEKVADTVLLIKQGNCLFRTGETMETAPSFALELETITDRNRLVEILGEDKVQVQYNGGFYTITSTEYGVNKIIADLLSNDVPISYFRDITHSTKRYF